MKVYPTKTIDEILTTLSYIIDIENNRNLYHHWRVAIITQKISVANKTTTFYAALLHDLGSVGLPRHIINYLIKPTPKNINLLLSHPIIGSQLIWLIPSMENSAHLVLNHHETFDGKGYPTAKRAKDIPQGSQIIRLADFIDIQINKKKDISLVELIQKIKEAENKEFLKSLGEEAVEILKREKFFYSLLNNKNIPELFKESKSKIHPFKMKKGIDAIGLTLEVVSQVIDMRHPFTAGHSLRVSRYAMAIALAMKLEHDEITKIKWAGLIHDIGKLTIPKIILNKPTTLTKGEFQKVAQHALMTEKILRMIPSLEEIIPIASFHHEHFNGKGYPYGLKKENIPLGARILCICDAFDAMTSNRPYRLPLSPKIACKKIKALSAKQFDPEIVRYAIPVLKNLCV